MSEVERRLQAAGVTLPKAPPPVANFAPAVRTGHLIFVSGQGPVEQGVPVITGLVGDTVSKDEAYRAAQLCAINTLAVLRQEVGDLDRVTQVVKLLGFVASQTGFNQQPAVMNGASDLLVLAFGDHIGKHARSAIGVSQLPFDIAVEIEVVFELREEGSGS